MRKTFVVVALIGIAGCVRHTRTSARTSEYGTCEGACEHYTDCRGSAEPRLGEECQQGLRAFFAKRAVPWAHSL